MEVKPANRKLKNFKLLGIYINKHIYQLYICLRYQNFFHSTVNNYSLSEALKDMKAKIRILAGCIRGLANVQEIMHNFEFLFLQYLSFW